MLLSYVVILYAQGYKYSFSEGKFFRTGAISLKVNTDVKVFLDDELEGRTSFFGNSFSIDRLLPGRYKLSVQKDDYSSWQKTVTVEEGLVIDFPQIMLLPEEGEEEQKLFDEVYLLFKEIEPIATIEPTPTPRKNSPSPSPKLTQTPYVLNVKTNKLYQNNDQGLEEIALNVKGFRVSDNENKLAWWTNNEIWIMWLDDTNYQPFYKKGDKEAKHVHKVAKEITVIVSGAFLMNGEKLEAGDVILLEPGEPADFECIEDGANAVIKTPSVLDDKYIM